jgi:hypothetical protein
MSSMLAERAIGCCRAFGDACAASLGTDAPSRSFIIVTSAGARIRACRGLLTAGTRGRFEGRGRGQGHAEPPESHCDLSAKEGDRGIVNLSSNHSRHTAASGIALIIDVATCRPQRSQVTIVNCRPLFGLC